MMHALEAEPEKEGRWKRMGIGAVIAVALGTGVIVAAKHVVPHSKLLQSVMKIAIVDYVPPKPKPRDEDTPKPPEPLPAKPKPKEKSAAADKAAPPPPSNQPPKPETGEPDIGLDADSFGSGSGGVAFHAGTSQMGAVSGGRPFSADAGVEAPKVAAKLVEARARASNRQPAYPEKARKLAIEGLMVIEADIDDRGNVTRATVRKPLEPSLDAEAQKTVLAWAFDPATLQGKAVPSTKFLRIRFQLE
jgi:periplasmic protein TonB